VLGDADADRRTDIRPSLSCPCNWLECGRDAIVGRHRNRVASGQRRT